MGTKGHDSDARKQDSDALLAVVVIEIHYEDTGKENDSIDCPVCEQKGTLSYSRGPKSLWAKCKTPGCVKFHADFK